VIRTARSRWIVAGFVLVAAGLLGPLSLAAIGLETGWAGFLTGLLMAAVPVPFYVAFALWVDRFEDEPPWLLAIAFLWGASIAVFFALLFNSINEAILGAEIGDVLTVPIVEELAKGAALLLLFVWRRDEFDNVTDGILYAGMIGLGFAMTENIQYYGKAAVAGDASAVFFLRGLLAPFAHPLYTSMTGIGFGIARESNRKAVKTLAPLLGLAAAIGLHAIWNLTARMGVVFFGAYVVIMMPAAIAVVLIAIFSLRREARLIRAHLDGVLHPDDIAGLSSVRMRVGACTHALFRGGYGAWVARRRFHSLATELAFHSWRTSREASDDAQAIREELLAAVVAARDRLKPGGALHA